MVRRRLRTLEAICALTAAFVLIRALPFAVGARLAGRLHQGDQQGIDRHPDDPAVRAVGAAIRSAARRVPFQATCLVRAIAGRLMLLRRGTASSLVIGVASRDGRPFAHAWLIASGGVVCGGSEAADFSPIVMWHSRSGRP